MAYAVLAADLDDGKLTGSVFALDSLPIDRLARRDGVIEHF